MFYQPCQLQRRRTKAGQRPEKGYHSVVIVDKRGENIYKCLARRTRFPSTPQAKLCFHGPLCINIHKAFVCVCGFISGKKT